MSAANFECDCVSCNMEVVLGLCPGYVGLNVWAEQESFDMWKGWGGPRGFEGGIG